MCRCVSNQCRDFAVSILLYKYLLQMVAYEIYSVIIVVGGNDAINSQTDHALYDFPRCQGSPPSTVKLQR